MTSILPVAISGLAAAKQSLSIRAANIAGANVTSNPETGVEAYRAKTPVQTTQPGGGVKVSAQEKDPATVERYVPYIAQTALVPNVSYEEEFVGMMQAGHAYKAAAAVIRAEDEMNKELFKSV